MPTPRRPTFTWLGLTMLLFSLDGLAAEAYETQFSARFDPASGTALAKIKVKQSENQLRQLDLALPAKRYSDITGDGIIERNGKRVIWQVPAKGGSLQYRVLINHQKGHAYDARMTEQWGILRLDDLFPPAKTRALVGTRSESSLRLSGPDDWTFESQYGPVRKTLHFDNPQRRFDRPTGWLAAGKLGIRRDIVSDRHVVVAAPINQGMRRLDTLAFLRWTLPRLVNVFDDFPDRLLIVGAQDEMWRGGLSGPASIYLHSDRPLISENRTSTLLHELVHVASAHMDTRDDWLVEGLAEYYSLEILRRSGAISQKRFEQAIRELQSWVERDQGRLHNPSKGANTARAALLLHDLATEIRQNDSGRLDELVARMMESGDLTGAHLVEITETMSGEPCTLLRSAMEELNADTP